MHIFNSRAGRVWAALAFAVMAGRGAWASQVFWTGNGGDSLWDDPANWAELGFGYLPQGGDDAINSTGNSIFYQSVDNYSVHSFTTNGEFVMNGGTLTAGTPGVSTLEVDGTFAYAAGTLSGFVINKGPGSQAIQIGGNSTNYFDNITSKVDLDLTLGGQLQITNGLTLGSSAMADVGNSGYLEFENTETLAGGTVTFSGTSTNSLNVEGTSALTISGTLIHGSTAIIGSQRYVSGANTIINDGTISADVNGGIFYLMGTSFINNGTLSAANGGTLRLNTNINNAGGNINVGSSSTVLVNNVTVTGGTINGPGALTFTASSSNDLDSVTSNANFDLTPGSWVRIENNLSLNAANSINLDNNARITFDNTQTFATGTINFGVDSTQYLSVEGASVLTLGAGAVVEGGSGVLGYQFFFGGANTITNNGLISANTAGTVLTVQPTTFNNTGIARAINGGDLKLAINSGTNSGTIIVDASSSAQLSSSNPLDNTGGNIVVNGIFTLSGGIIANGNISGAGSLTASGSSSNLLSGVAISAPIDLANAGVIVMDNSTLSANASLDNSGRIYTEDQTTFASGTITLGANSTQYISVEGIGTLTIDGHATIHGSEGVLGFQFLVGGANNIVNHGTINSDSSGGLIQIIGTNFSNDGITEATNGATLNLNSTNSFNSGTLAANGISSVLALVSTTLDNTGGTISSSGGGSIFMNNAAISNGSITNTGGGSLTATGTSNNSLNNVTVSTLVNLSNGGRFQFNNSTLAGNANLDNTAVMYVEGNSTFASGTISLGGDSTQYISVEGTGTLTINAPVFIHGTNGIIGYQFLTNGANSIVNHGIISSDSPGGTISIAGTLFSNTGTTEADSGGTLILNTTNSSNTHSLVAAGTNSVLTLLNTALNNTGGTIAASGGGAIHLSNGNITGGAINSSTGGTITATNSSGNVIDAATVNAAFNLSDGGRFQLQDSSANFISAAMDNTAVIFMQGNDTITGGTITFGGDGTQYISAEGGSSLTVDAGATIHGQTGYLGYQFLLNGSAGITNKGDIDADVGGGTITIAYNTTAINQGTLEAKNGGALELNSSINNAGGTIRANAGGTVSFNGITVSSGTVSGPGELFFTSGPNTFDGVTVNGNLDMASTGRLQIVDGLTLSGTANLDNAGIIFSLNSQTITGGTFNFGANSTQYISIEGTSSLTLSSTTLVHGITGYIGYQFVTNGSNTLINHGTIDADGVGAVFQIATNTFTNTGSVHAAAGNSIFIAHGETQTAGSSIADGTITISDGGLTLSGGTLGGNGTFAVTGPAAWSGGSVVGNGLLSINGDVSISNSVVRSGQGLIYIDGNLTLNPGAKLDLTRSDMILDYRNTAVTPVATVATELATAYDHGKWDTAGIGSSVAGAGLSAGTTLGYGDNIVLGYATFDSQPVISETVFIKYTWFGDANLDGKVDGNDLARLTAGQSGNLTGWVNGDFNYDGSVNSDDFALFMLGAAKQTGILAPTVPEPALLGIVLLPLLQRRRKHS